MLFWSQERLEESLQVQESSLHHSVHSISSWSVATSIWYVARSERNWSQNEYLTWFISHRISLDFKRWTLMSLKSHLVTKIQKVIASSNIESSLRFGWVEVQSLAMHLAFSYHLKLFSCVNQIHQTLWQDGKGSVSFVTKYTEPSRISEQSLIK